MLMSVLQYVRLHPASIASLSAIPPPLLDKMCTKQTQSNWNKMTCNLISRRRIKNPLPIRPHCSQLFIFYFGFDSLDASRMPQVANILQELNGQCNQHV
jgi:hypothetical protein